MVQAEDAKAGADELLAAAMVGVGWEEALQKLADAAGAGGASLVRFHGGRWLAHLSSTDWAESEAFAIAGGAPPSPLRFYPEHAYGSGFRADHEVWTDGELRRDAYYQEFLRPRGVFYHAKARLWLEQGERVTLTLKRRARLGPYEPSDIAVLDNTIPQLRAAFRISRRVLDAEAEGIAHLLHQRGEPVFELDAFGRVVRVHGGDVEQSGLLLRNRRLAAVDRLAQASLERAVAAAVTPPQRPALVAIADQQGKRRLIQTVPVAGHARNVFPATAAIAVVMGPSPRSAIDGLTSDGIREAFGLTHREGQIAGLLADGLSLAQIASRLHLGVGTVRNHLKRVFAKTDTTRQGQLIALLHTLKL